MNVDIQGRLQALSSGCGNLIESTLNGTFGIVEGAGAAVFGLLTLPIGGRGVYSLNKPAQVHLRLAGLVIPNLFATGIKLLNPQAAFPKRSHMISSAVMFSSNDFQGVVTAKVFHLHFKTMKTIKNKNWFIRQTIVKLTEPFFLINYIAARALDAIAGLFGVLVVLVKRGQSDAPISQPQPEEVGLVELESTRRGTPISPTELQKQEGKGLSHKSVSWNTWTYRQLQITQLLSDIHLCAMRFINADTYQSSNFPQESN